MSSSKKNTNNALTRRFFLKAASVLVPSILISPKTFAQSSASMVEIAQLIYRGGNWQPRPTALRHLSWEIQKRTSIKTVLEPTPIQPVPGKLSTRPIAYLSGDRPFEPFTQAWINALSRYLKSGGTLIIDPAITPDGNLKEFESGVTKMIESALPGIEPVTISIEHVIFRSFYKISRPEGLHKGSPNLTGYMLDNRVAIIRTDHDLGGAYARDNLGNWEYDIQPGGSRQRENAFRLGINLIMYSLCGDYKDELPHKIFNQQ